ncbi:sigma-70 family RNA polymerase sigma factor [Luteolibacter ambystomatis]|uniref:Sigma-70 family RNA polymerase sigma factor n=1 Tax=Luteolibacter ambystomatis TaxID=2824561 RepID=A0A975IZN0_9BACT|nr:sigma-70 family RNA polymerase sigma factor [Luteolibacter ambystomatis]QUE51118.1 sigma-70 family RNA polymerase sigma factor [Luteolibacter ambystomatis]
MDESQIQYLQLVTRHQPAIYGYIRSLAPQADVEDILQETNLVLWNKADVFEPGSNFKAFAFRIAHLKTLEALRSDRRRQWLVFDSDLMEQISTRRSSAEANADGQQAALRECMKQLDPGDRELIHRRYALGSTVRDMARDLRKTEGSLQQWFFRMRNQLRDCIEKRIKMEGGAA